MTDPSQSMELNTPLNLTPEEKRVFGELFRQADTEQMGVVTGEVAVKFFERTKLPPQVLGEIWQIADTENRGLLTSSGFCQVLRLIGHFQAGKAPTPELAFQPGPLPKFDNSPPSGPAAPGPIQPQMSGPIRVPPLAPERAAQYAALFEKSGAVNGVLPGETAKNIFEKARLPNETLGRVWALADTEQRGALGVTEFIIAMHLIQSLSSGAMKGLPSSLPAGPIPRQFSGQNTGRGQSPMSGRPPFATPPHKVDTQGRGFITGEQAVVFFSDSGLPEERPKPGVQFLPPSLPPALIPPSMRSSAARPPAQSQPPATFGTTASFPAPAAPAVPAPKSASEDLFGLDAFTASPPVQPQSTGGSGANFPANKDPFGNGAASPASPSRGTFQPTPQNPTSIFKPFMPSSSFGQTLTAQGTGGSGSQPRSPAPPQPSAMDDLLGDNDQEQSKKLTDESAELGNIKASTEAELNTTSAQKRDLEMRLSQFRAQYEAEVQIVKQLEERLNASRQETRKLQQEMAMLEGSYQDLSSQHQQVASALEADQRENANLKERIRQTNAEVAQLRPQLDKMRSEARQQKGMVAINKKQLATNEGEREKLKNEMSELTKAAQESYNRSPEATPGPTVAASPAPSNASHSTNPFFRRSPQPAENTMSPSGFSREASQANFDNFFGPSISSGVPTPSTSPPLSQYHESPRVGEPPAPPESRQFSSSILPIREGAARQGSFSSSVKAAPPTSRFGAPGNETPTNAPGSPSASAAEPAKDTSAPEFGPSPFNRNLTSSPAASHVSDAARSASGVERKDTFQSFGPPSTSVDMPGSFPEVSTPLKPETTGQSAMSDRSKGSFSFPRSDPFGSQPQRQGSAAKADFDAAFAGFGAGKQFQERQNTGSSLNGSVGSASKFNQEFPPIENLGGDDESDSNSEHGFDDNFAPSSPQAKRDDAAPAPTTSGPEGTGDSGNPFSRDNSNLPTPNAQKPPPTYEQTTGNRSGARGSDSFPPEFGGLLPSRQDPTAQSGSQSPEKTFSSPVLTPGQTLFGGSSAAGKAPATGPFSPGSTSNANTPSSTVPSDAYHSAQSYPSTDKASPANQAPGSQSFGDDFDAGFDDLAEAKDATNAHDDDDLFGSSHRDGLDEFNPVFDSPAASKSNTMASQATPTNNASKNHAEDSFSDFEHLTQSFASSKPATQSAAASGHDWDAIFSGLSDSQPAPSTGGNTAPQTADSSQMLGAPSGSEQPASGDEAEKPHLGRALSAGTEHDDPILKNLTSMGYQRGDALAALEKYDYDINKAVEYLSSK
ncbi:UBS TS-N domain-containing protein [Lasiodiplodia theobromae]|uniref:UBS TS-N domain-containing protein n=1 Tax=Lasiodiplodia theobromae TaxID=45133 RepID=UPI0015C309B0|nr:UBS TS-N domain-containing protein [Lasiodiplodia theobromae]KAF4537261.1 UBS TS-N domain-containing protein [Lasiodiplodia theobromae]